MMLMNFKQREEVLPSALILLAILTLAGTLIYMVAVPMPSASGVAKGRLRSRQQLEKQIADAKQHTAEMEVANKPRLWTDNPERVTASVLAQLTHEANRRSLKLGAFRPQKTQQLAGVIELPFSVQLAGPYGDVRSVVATLDGANSRLAIRTIQIAASDAASSAVTATLGVSAYLPATATNTKTGKTTTSVARPAASPVPAASPRSVPSATGGAKK